MRTILSESEKIVKVRTWMQLRTDEIIGHLRDKHFQPVQNSLKDYYKGSHRVEVYDMTFIHYINDHPVKGLQGNNFTESFDYISKNF